MTAAATQWLWNFAVSKATPLMVIHLPHGGIVSLLLFLYYLPG